jgi:hypothetical protein
MRSSGLLGKCPEFFAHLVWAERRPALGLSGDSTSHLLVLQQLDIQIAFG